MNIMPVIMAILNIEKNIFMSFTKVSPSLVNV